MNKNLISCPACSSDAVTVTKVEKEITLPFGNQKKISIDEYTCAVCGFQGDFTGANDKIISEAYDNANLETVNNIVDEFARYKTSMAAIERALELPQRTVTKWKNGLSHPSATGIALMKMIGTFPWLLEVAENKYEPRSSKYIFLSNAIKDFLQVSDQFSPINHFWSAGVVMTPTSVVMYQRLDQNENMPVMANKDVIIEGQLDNPKLMCNK